MTVDVVVPTFRRPMLLARCLRALEAQTHPADKVVVVIRRGDEDSRRVVSESRRLPLRLVEVDQPGVVAALRGGVAVTSSEVVAFTDDDAVPAPDWLAGLLSLLAGEGVGAAGGRDVIPGQTEPRRRDVGRFTHWGKSIGNHHLGEGPPREVDLLKGVNMAFRAEALALPRRGVLRGDGAEVHFEVLCCRAATHDGFRIVYDPAVEVGHLGAERIGADRRRSPEASAVRAAAYNALVATTALDRRWALRQTAYSLLVGSRDAPGVLRGFAALPRREREVLRRWPHALSGTLAALPRVLLPARAPLVSADSLRRRGDDAPRLAVVAHEIHGGGGMERAMSEVVRRAVDRYEVHVYSGRLAPELRESVVWHRVIVPRRPAALAFVAFFVRVGVALRVSKPDIVHTLGAIVPNHVDVSTVQYCHAAYREVGGRFGAPGANPLRRLNTAAARELALLAERWCYRASRVGRLVAVSHGVRDELARFYPDVASVVIPNGVDSARFAPDAELRASTRAAERVGEDEFVVLFVGSEWARKGLDIAIEGFARARRRHAVLGRFWVVGTGDRPRYEALAARHGVADAVRFLGRRDDTEQLFAAADVFVFPSLYEAFPLAVLEAAAAGLPIVATAANGVTDLVGDGEAGLIVDRDPGAIADALFRLVGDPQLRRTLGRNARVRASRYDWDAPVAELFEAYRAAEAAGG